MAKEKESAVKKITPQLNCGIAINRFADHPQTPDNFSRYIYKENYRKFKINVVLKDTSNVCKLDKLDCKMIRLLQKDGRMSNIEIAQQLGISEHTVRNRMKYRVFFEAWVFTSIMECWNSRFSKDAIHFKLYRQDEFCHLPNIAVSQDPVFQYSSVPLFQLGEAPNLKLKETLFFILKSLRLLRSL